MYRRLASLCLVAAVASLVTAQTMELETRSFLDGKLQLLIPTQFELMDEETLRVKYPSESRPTTVFTDKQGSFNVAVNHTSNAMTLGQLGGFHPVVDQMFRNLYPAATWYRSELTTINGRQCFILELLTPAIDTEVYNIIVGTSLDDRVLLVSVNLTKALAEQYLSTAQQIAMSITVTD